MKIPGKNHDAATESLGDAALDALVQNSAPCEAPTEPAKVESAPTEPAALEPKPATPPAEAEPPFVAKLEAATQDLLMLSETDAPFRVVYWPLEKAELSPSEVAFYAAEKADAPVETRSVAEFFENAVSVEDWMKDDEKATAKRFQDLIETLNAELKSPQVYLIGQIERIVAVIGQVEGGFGGVITLVVET